MNITKINRLLFDRKTNGAEVAQAIGIPQNRFYAVANNHDKTQWVRKAIADHLRVRVKTLFPDFRPTRKYRTKEYEYVNGERIAINQN